MANKIKSLEISRRIEASAHSVFEILANPGRHIDFDGSGMLCGSVHESSITKVGDSFMMKMHRLGDDAMIVKKINEKWTEIWAGQDVISCAVRDKNQIPISLAPDCL